MKNTSLTKVIIISKNNKEKLKLIKEEFEELNNWKYNSNKEFKYKIVLKDKSLLIIINQKSSTSEMIINKLEKETK